MPESEVNEKPALPNIYRHPKVGNIVLAFGVVMFAVFVASANMIATHQKTHLFESISLGAVWVVGVPLFFFFERVVLFRK